MTAEQKLGLTPGVSSHSCLRNLRSTEETAVKLLYEFFRFAVQSTLPACTRPNGRDVKMSIS
jgi:hypothetical protein